MPNRHPDHRPNRRIVDRRLARTASVLALLLALAPPVPGLAQLGPAGNEEGPIRIQSDAGIEWQQNQRVYIARGNAVAARGTNEVRADTLIAHYRDKPGGQTPGSQTGTAAAPSGGAQAANSPAGNSPVGSLTGEGGGSTEIYRIEAIGNVVLKHQASTAVGDRAVYDIDQGIAVVTGGNLKLTTTTDVVTARDSLEWYDGKQIAVARGNAVATRASKTIKADTLTAYMRKSAQPAAKPPQAKTAAHAQPAGRRPSGAAHQETISGGQEGESQISRVDAQGHVVITDALNTGRGDFGVYNGDTGIATLIGNVVIQRGANVIQGERGVMDLNNNVARMMPGGNAGGGGARVQGLLVRDQAKSGAAKSDAGSGGERKHP